MPLCNWSGGHNSCNSCVTWTATRLSFLIQVVMPQHTNDIGLASLSLLLVDAYIVNQTNGAPNKPLVGCLSLGSPCATHRLLMSGNALSYAGVHPSTLVHTLHVITCQQLPIFYYIIPLLSLTSHLLRSSSSLNTRQDILESLIRGEPAPLLLNLATPC